VSAHKVGGPVGIGALVLARTATVEPLLHGGDQQRGRSGTQDAAGAAAFGVAAARAVGELPLTRVAALRDRLVAGVLASVDGAVLRGAPGEGRLPGNAHFTFAGADGDALLYLLDASGIAVSTGSACQAGVPELSHVLLAMGVPEAEARGALRITLGHDSSDADVDALLTALPDAVARARAAAAG
jgi:cysteine desulfurase